MSQAFAHYDDQKTDTSNPDFAASYGSHFELVRADSPELLDEAYRLRYQVYCVENPFEDAADHSSGVERDVDDDRSVHMLLKHRRPGIFAGTVRVILPLRGVPFRPLPVHQILASQDYDFSRLPPPQNMAEISRFAISKDFRRRLGEERYPDVAQPHRAARISDERRLVRHITFGLIRGVLEICGDYRITHICAVMEPALIRILRGFGLDFEPIGDLVEHHGIRQPCVARLRDLVERNRTESTLLWQYTARYALPLLAPCWPPKAEAVIDPTVSEHRSRRILNVPFRQMF